MDNRAQAENITFREVVRILFKNIGFITGIILLSLTFAFIYLYTVVPQYQAKAKILVSSERKGIDPYYVHLDAIRNAEPSITQGELVKNRGVLENVVRSLRLDKRNDKEMFFPRLKTLIQPTVEFLGKTYRTLVREFKRKIFGENAAEIERSDFDKAVEGLRKNIDVERVEESDVFYINVNDYNPRMVKDITNEITRQYLIYDLQQQIRNLSTRFGKKHKKIVQLHDIIKKSEVLNIEGFVAGEFGTGLGTVKVIEFAEQPVKPFSPRKKIIFIATLFFGIFAGLSLVLALEGVDSTFKNPWEFEEWTGVPVLGSVPRKKGIKSRNLFLKRLNGKGGYCSAFNKTAEQIFLMVKDKKLKTLLFTDVNSNCNAGVNAYNIARFMSEKFGMKTLLIEANLREPVLREAIETKVTGGFSNILSKKCGVEEGSSDISDNLSFIHEGNVEYNPLVLFMTEQVNSFFAEVETKYDIIVINSSPISKYRDSFVLSIKVDGVVVTLEEGRVKKEVAENLINEFSNSERTLLGAIFNNRTWPVPGMLYKKL